MTAYQRLATGLDLALNRLFTPVASGPAQRWLQKLFVWKTRWLGPLRLNPLDRAQVGPEQRAISLCDWHFSPADYRRALPALLDLCRTSTREEQFAPTFFQVLYIPANTQGAGYTSRQAAFGGPVLVLPERPAVCATRAAMGGPGAIAGGIPRSTSAPTTSWSLRTYGASTERPTMRVSEPCVMSSTPTDAFAAALEAHLRAPA